MQSKNTQSVAIWPSQLATRMAGREGCSMTTTLHTAATREYTSEDRYKLEKTILGACLIEAAAYGRIARFLSPKNFADRNHAAIWRGMSDLWPNRPIDLRTVYHQLVTRYGLQLAPHLVNCTTHVNSAANLEEHSICLIECDIRVKVQMVLRDVGIRDLDSNIREIAQKIWLAIEESPDVTATLEYAAEYLQLVCPGHSLTTKIAKYNLACVKKIEQIRANYPARHLIKNLEGLGRIGNHKQQMAIEKLTDLLITTINSATVSDDFLSNLNQLHL